MPLSPLTSHNLSRPLTHTHIHAYTYVTHTHAAPADRIHEVEIPTGLPMIYDHESRRIRLLDDDEVPDPMAKYEFGSSPELFIKMDDDDLAV